MEKLTDMGARLEAVERWGKRAEVRRRRTPTHASNGSLILGTHDVGINVGGAFICLGTGLSWEEAFEDASRGGTDA